MAEQMESQPQILFLAWCSLKETELRGPEWDQRKRPLTEVLPETLLGKNESLWKSWKFWSRIFELEIRPKDADVKF